MQRSKDTTISFWHTDDHRLIVFKGRVLGLRGEGHSGLQEIAR